MSTGRSFFILVPGILAMAVLAAFIGVLHLLADKPSVELRVCYNEIAATHNIDTGSIDNINSLLRIQILYEIAKVKFSTKKLMMLELTESIASITHDANQMNDMKDIIRTLIKEKERERGRILSTIDRVASWSYLFNKRSLSEKSKNEIGRLLKKSKADGKKEDMVQHYFDIGSAYIMADDIGSAEVTFSKLNELAPDIKMSMRTKFSIGWAYKNKGDYGRAEECFEAIGKDGSDPDLLLARDNELADILVKKKNYDKAREAYIALSTQYTKREEAALGLFQVGYLSLYRLNDSDAASLYFSECQKKFSDISLVRRCSARAQDTISKNLQLKGYSLLREKKYKEALEIFSEAIKLMPDDFVSRSGAGVSLFWLDKKDDAIKGTVSAAHELLKINEYKTKWADIVFSNALFILVKSEKYKDAIHLGNVVLEKKSVARKAFYYNLGCAYMLNSEPKNAVDYFQKALSMDPDFVAAYNNQACALWAIARYNDAIRYFRISLALDPAFTQPRFNLGVIGVVTNQYKDAYDNFKSVLQIDPADKKTKEYLEAVTKKLDYKPD